MFRLKSTEKKFEEITAVDVAVKTPVHPFVQFHEPVKPRRLIARRLDNGADHLCALGVMLEIDFIRVQNDVQLIGEKTPPQIV